MRAVLRRVKIVVLAGVLASVPGAWPAAGAGADSEADSIDVPRLIQNLADPDASVRKGAAERLQAIGSAARAQVVKASRSPDPEQRAQAAQVLLHLPWWDPDDPPRVRELLHA